MVRMQVQLDDAQSEALRRQAADTGRSIADLIREGVDLYLAASKKPTREEQVQRALAASGRFASGTKDASTRHDHYLAEAFRA